MDFVVVKSGNSLMEISRHAVAVPGEWNCCWEQGPMSILGVIETQPPSYWLRRETM